jgi:heme exporter protein A
MSAMETSAMNADSFSFPTLDLHASGLTHRFNNRTVWRGVELRVQGGQTLGITGSNGTGKTTLLRVLCGLLRPSEGAMTLRIDGKEIEDDEIVQYVGFVAPYLTLYEEFTLREHLFMLSAMHGNSVDAVRAEQLLRHFDLWERRADELRGFSSGMKQRVKYICALLFAPPLLVLDEPMTNLDAAGIEAVERLLQAHVQAGGACLIATNDARDLALCNAQLSVMDFAAGEVTS